jgi:hypothetical protein
MAGSRWSNLGGVVGTRDSKEFWDFARILDILLSCPQTRYRSQEKEKIRKDSQDFGLKWNTVCVCVSVCVCVCVCVRICTKYF